MADNPYVNKVEYGGETLIDLTGDTVTPETMLEGATAHDKSGAPISGAVAVAPPSTTTPAMDGTASVGTETAYARGDHVHPRDTSKQDTLESGINIKTVNNQSLLGPGNINVPGGGESVFVATIGQTTHAELLSAYNNGSVILAKQGDSIYYFQSKIGSTFIFSHIGRIEPAPNLQERYYIILFYCKSDSTWTFAEIRDLASETYVNNRFPEVTTQGGWRYRCYADGTFEAWYKATGQRLTITSQSGNLYRSELQTITLPTDMTSGKTCNILHVSVNASHNNYPTWGMLASIQTPTANTFTYYAMSGGSRTASPNYLVTAYVFGTLE